MGSRRDTVHPYLLPAGPSTYVKISRGRLAECPRRRHRWHGVVNGGDRKGEEGPPLTDFLPFLLGRKDRGERRPERKDCTKKVPIRYRLLRSSLSLASFFLEERSRSAERKSRPSRTLSSTTSRHPRRGSEVDLAWRHDAGLCCVVVVVCCVARSGNRHVTRVASLSLAPVSCQ